MTPFYYNPNIGDNDEYQLRLCELDRYCNDLNLNLIEYPPDTEAWMSEVSAFAKLGERSRRCYLCYQHRMERTFQYAREHGFDAVSTVLSVSPYKVYAWIKEIGIALSGKYDIGFYDADFKKNNGFLVSVQNSKQYRFYRQDYCGCEWSRIERESKNTLKGERQKDY